MLITDSLNHSFDWMRVLPLPNKIKFVIFCEFFIFSTSMCHSIMKISFIYLHSIHEFDSPSSMRESFMQISLVQQLIRDKYHPQPLCRVFNKFSAKIFIFPFMFPSLKIVLSDELYGLRDPLCKNFPIRLELTLVYSISEVLMFFENLISHKK